MTPISTFGLTYLNFSHIDTEKPRIECPESLEYLVASGETHKGSWNEPVFSDNCGFAAKTQSHYPNDYFSVGVTTVSYRVRDPFGNSVICRFNITVTGKIHLFAK